MNEPQHASIFDLFEEPWYVIVGIIGAVVVMQRVEKRLKAAGKWPYKGDNWSIDQLIWMSVLLPIAIIGGLIAYQLG